MPYGHINIYKVTANMNIRWGLMVLVLVAGLNPVFSVTEKEEQLPETILQPVEPLIGSWSFSGVVSNENGDRYGYFFQVQRQDTEFKVKTGVIDAQNDHLVLFYEGKEQIEHFDQLNWHIGQAFIRYNPINDSWIFGVKKENEVGFNFKVDMLKQEAQKEQFYLRPGVQLKVTQTTRLNGNIHIDSDNKEQFVTGNNAWFAKLWFSEEQKIAHKVNTVFCHLSNDNGFYSANLKEADATDAAVAEWRDASGNKVKMSQFISLKNLTDNQSLLTVGWPKLNLRLINTLQHENNLVSLAGFSKETPKSFCFAMEQPFKGINSVA